MRLYAPYRTDSLPISANNLSRLEFVQESVERNKLLAPKPACYLLGLRGVLEGLVELVLAKRRDIHVEVYSEGLACFREVAAGGNKVVRCFFGYSVAEGAGWRKAEVFLEYDDDDDVVLLRYTLKRVSGPPI